MRNILAFVFVLVAGCGGEGQVAGKVACEFRSSAASGVSVHSCTEIEAGDIGEQESQCKDSGDLEATLVDGCSTDDVLGTCVVTRGGETMTMYYYHAEGFTEEAAKPSCEALNGTWTAS
ncbi:hypothetical protein [Sorangium cellulosum]|uniref:Uncharacterized protein n=1 Tax=Sorangium cellulosum TaxID=56 RepID=A0A150QXX0_SORCE|nr:hypothetical protein [Sorangium cellulosum]KYF72775.1 hypothetical protein BE15_02695 [Sorangium cellulosum]